MARLEDLPTELHIQIMSYMVFMVRRCYAEFPTRDLFHAAAASTHLRGAVLRFMQQPLDALYQEKKNYVGSDNRNKKMRKGLNRQINRKLVVKGWVEEGKTYDEAMQLGMVAGPTTGLLGGSQKEDLVWRRPHTNSVHLAGVSRCLS